MKGVYIARIDLTKSEFLGVNRKIHAQLEVFKRNFEEVDVYSLGENGALIRNSQIVSDYPQGKVNSKVSHYFRFYRDVSKEKINPGFIYIRYQKCDPFFLMMLRRFRYKFPNIKILIEIPSFPYDGECKTLRDKVLMLIDNSTRWAMRYYVDYVVTFSRAKKIFGIETICTDNGINLDDIPLIEPPRGKTSLRLAGMANVSFWHGYDRIIKGIHEHRLENREREIYFDVIGSGPSLDLLKSLVSKFNLEAIVTLHGPKSGEQLAEVLQKCDIGVSSIGLHRINMDSSMLKSAEFCAAGMPFVTSIKDRNFTADFDFNYEIPDSEASVCIADVINFYDNLSASHPRYHFEMRSWAEKNLTWDIKLEQVVNQILSRDRVDRVL
jgi:hypothetical protein